MSDEKKVLIDVDIKATAALKELAELRIKADELRKAQQELDTTTEEGRAQYDERGQEQNGIFEPDFFVTIPIQKSSTFAHR